MSARGHTEPRPWKAEARCQRKVALGVGPQRQWKKRLRPSRAEDCESEARDQRQVAAGVGPRRQWKKVGRVPDIISSCMSERQTRTE